MFSNSAGLTAQTVKSVNLALKTTLHARHNVIIRCCLIATDTDLAWSATRVALGQILDHQQPVLVRGWQDDGKKRADPSRDRFRHNLAVIMADQGITQAGLARRMDVSRVAVHAWIWGTCFPETSRLIKLAQALNVPIGGLLEGPTDEQHAPASSNEEILLLSAFRKLSNTARLTLLADAYEMTMRVPAQDKTPAPELARTENA